MVLETSVKSLYDELNSIEEYMEIIEHAGQLQTPENVWLKYWDCDKEFGRQTLNGMNPTCIRRWVHVRAPDKDCELKCMFVGVLVGLGIKREEGA